MSEEAVAASGLAAGCGRWANFEPGANSVLVYFGCDDCAVVAAKAVASGGRLQKAKTSIGPHGFFSLVVDPEGDMIGLHSMG